MPRGWSQGRRTEQSEDTAARDGECPREEGIASELRPPLSDVAESSDPTRSVRTRAESIDGTSPPSSATPTSSTESAIVGGKRPSCSTEPSCGSVPSEPEAQQETSKMCGLQVCGSNLQYRRSSAGTCDECGGGVSHGEDELLCAACHRTLETPVMHLGWGVHHVLATKWVEQCRSAGAELPARVLPTFEPSPSCLCAREDCFYTAFERCRRQLFERECSPCGRISPTSDGCPAGPMCHQYQVFFSDGTWSKKTEARMVATKKVITVDSWICNHCRSDFKNAGNEGWRPTVKALVATPMDSEGLPPRGPARAVATVTRSIQESLARGDILCSEGIERSLHRALEEDECLATSSENIPSMVEKLLTDIQDGVSDVRVHEDSAASSGEDASRRFMFITVMPLQLRGIVALDRELRRKNQKIIDLRHQLREARGEVRYVSPRA